MKTNQPNHAEKEESLVRMAAHGDLMAFNQLVLQYQNLAYYHAYALLGDHALADDATQESFIKAFCAVSTFRGGSFRSWLVKIVTNSAYDMLRQARRHPTQLLYPADEDGEEMESPSWIMDHSSSVQGLVEQKELAKEIFAKLDELPDIFRSVITLIDLYELDYAEAAKALQFPMGTVKSRLARARYQMKEKLTGTMSNEEFSIGTRVAA